MRAWTRCLRGCRRRFDAGPEGLIPTRLANDSSTAPPSSGLRPMGVRIEPGPDSKPAVGAGPGMAAPAGDSGARGEPGEFEVHEQLQPVLGLAGRSGQECRRPARAIGWSLGAQCGGPGQGDRRRRTFPLVQNRISAARIGARSPPAPSQACITCPAASSRVTPGWVAASVVLPCRLRRVARESASFAVAAHARFRRKRCRVQPISPLAPHDADRSRRNPAPAVLSDAAGTGGVAAGQTLDCGRAREKYSTRDMPTLLRVPRPRNTAGAGHKRPASPLVQHARQNCTRQGKSTLGPLQLDRARWRAGAGKLYAGREAYPPPHRHRFAARAYNRRTVPSGPTPPRSDRGLPHETASPRNSSACGQIRPMIRPDRR
jgi:hypothetical protein